MSETFPHLPLTSDHIGVTLRNTDDASAAVALEARGSTIYLYPSDRADLGITIAGVDEPVAPTYLVVALDASGVPLGSRRAVEAPDFRAAAEIHHRLLSSPGARNYLVADVRGLATRGTRFVRVEPTGGYTTRELAMSELSE